MKTAFQHGPVTCLEADGLFWVYLGDKLIRTAPSIGMAREIAAGAAA